jgi:hypothetical protein
MENGEPKLKFQHYLGQRVYKNIHPNAQKVNEVVKTVIEKFGL